MRGLLKSDAKFLFMGNTLPFASWQGTILDSSICGSSSNCALLPRIALPEKTMFGNSNYESTIPP